MQRPFLSIIMPVYKAEKYLQKAVYSILEQTFHDFELILIDDGSPDRCGKMCDEFAQKDSRVSVIHFAENKGVRITRNTAMKQAKGEYITFVDADDVIAQDMYETVCGAAIEHHMPDTVVFGLKEMYYDKNGELKDTRTVTLPTAYFGEQTALRSYVITLEQSTLYGYLWNKLYKAEHIQKNSIEIRNYAIASDFFFNCDFFMEIETMLVLDIAPYEYNRRIDEGLTSKFFADFFETQEDRVASVLGQYDAWDMCTPQIERIMADIYIRYVFAGLQRLYDPRANKTAKMRKEWLEKLYTSPLYIRLMPNAKPENRLVKLMCWLIKGKHTRLTIIAAWTMQKVRKGCPLLFSKLKQNR